MEGWNRDRWVGHRGFHGQNGWKSKKCIQWIMFYFFDNTSSALVVRSSAPAGIGSSSIELPMAMASLRERNHGNMKWVEQTAGLGLSSPIFVGGFSENFNCWPNASRTPWSTSIGPKWWGNSPGGRKGRGREASSDNIQWFLSLFATEMPIRRTRYTRTPSAPKRTRPYSFCSVSF